jgi:hypothetical protein
VVLTKKPTAKKQVRKRKYSVDETLNENEPVLKVAKTIVKNHQKELVDEGDDDEIQEPEAAVKATTKNHRKEPVDGVDDEGDDDEIQAAAKITTKPKRKVLRLTSINELLELDDDDDLSEGKFSLTLLIFFISTFLISLISLFL